jgi:hypothetical protein
MKVNHYKHSVEAMRWTNTIEDREKFATWFEQYGAMLETLGPEVVLPEHSAERCTGTERGIAAVGAWILYFDGVFIAMDDELFVDLYEEEDPMTAARPCSSNTPSWFIGHWRYWHRGHGHDCDKNDDKPRSGAAISEIAQHAANKDTGYLTDAELRLLRDRTTSGDTLLVRALDELRGRRTGDTQRDTQRTAELTEALDIFNATWCPEHGHSPSPEQFARIEELRKRSTRSNR